MDGIDPRHASREKASIVRSPISLEIDVRQDEAGQDEEGVDTQTGSIQGADGVGA